MEAFVCLSHQSFSSFSPFINQTYCLAIDDILKSSGQEAVTHLKVAYMPPIQDIGPEPMYVQFEFSVSDEDGGKLTGLLFNITVMPVDDQTPKVCMCSRRDLSSCIITGYKNSLVPLLTKCYLSDFYQPCEN